ncbi:MULTISPECIES: phage tail tape measure protein [Serratia]|uniref:phage tail tape measure protein n=1 Tax=Serratia TaxID=613 RepID=UPI0021782E62|nr:phage tail tape measure protein [Serratia marcescens]CAI1726553.1 Uncharacterised protein [Serratia marcescens]
MASKSLGTLTIDLVAKTGGFVRGMDDAERKSQKWRKQVESDAKAAGVAIGTVATAAASAGVAAIKLLQSTASQVTETDRWAKSLNMSTQELLAWQFAAQKAGLSGDNMADIFKDLGDKIGDAVINKSGEAVDALDALGLSAEKLSKVSPDKQMLAIGEALSKIGTNAGKITILESLGNDLSKMLPLFDNNNQKLKEFIQLSKDYGVAPDPASIDDLVKVNSLFEDMEAQAKALKVEIATGLAKVDLSPMQDALKDLKDVFTDKAVLEGLVEIVNQVSQLAGYMGQAAKFVKPFIDQIGGSFKIDDDATDSAIKTRIEWLKESRKTSDSITTLPDRWLGLKENSAEIDAELEHLNKILNARKAVSVLNLPTAQATVSTDGFALPAGGSNGKPKSNKSSSGGNKLENAYKSMEQGYLRQIALIDKVTGKEKESTELQKLLFDMTTGRLSGLNEYQKKNLESLATEVDKLKVLERFKDLQEDLLTPEQKLLETTKERLKLLNEARAAGFASPEQYQKAGDAIAKSAFMEMPKFEGIDPLYGGQIGEMKKVDEAQSALEKWYQTQLDMLAENRQSQADLNEQWDAQELAIKQKHQDELNSIEQSRNMLMLSSMIDGFGAMADATRAAFGEQSGIYKAAFIAQKAAAIAQATIAIDQGIAMAAANPFPYNLAAMATVAASTAGLVSNITAVGMAHSGIDAVPETGTWLLQKGERVVTAQTSAKLDATLERVGRDTNAGGNTYQPSFEMHINGNPDDRTIAMMEQAVKRGAQQGYMMVANDLAQGKGTASKALGNGWNVGRRKI